MRDATGRNTWYSRGYLPHFDEINLTQMITFRLADSLPQARRLELAEARKRKEKVDFDSWLDAGHGQCWLRDPDVAQLVEDTLLHFDNSRYKLFAWVIMPNHVHTMVRFFPDCPMAKAVLSWKSYTARKANAHLGLSGPFYMRDYHDRFMRDAEHFASAVEYIEYNPVKAGLARVKEEFPWSSARFRAKGLL
jgi:putative transposase